ncbi:bifunctional phosphopantothenoylcysteine decarboxylase/phosphopantothenate--cysteine ligase CoaBC [Geochorda subterranea]|uniref:Coenzyme A biosynthesis bifunctional protein CoaBC n=1 Tax=Geochorda subterranea TaxID=3109564 RepID=A0ABZ1BN86_9FIRM|nr:bifunctional phosphopantothenoylcysteine decarboxylase/phosphopantothenate--cysteine ligase CoaBC [Limnochorda sp. LNt]WRP14028.1 bifunctional phosphopantothenoylcysteine decarboxylase/phosphopantothenate--cysteine ligase CoaBC [Limnochorda sp. LNt]
MEGKYLPDEQPLGGRTILVGVSGGIAAYKAVDVVRRLARLGADVHVVMTRAATRLVGPATFRELSYNPVITDLFEPHPRVVMSHVTLARKADLLCIAPATADVIAKMAAGIADDALTTTYLACRAPVLLAPAMNDAMWEHPATQENVGRLRARGHVVVGPAHGPLATGHEGRGRMEEPHRIVEEVRCLLHPVKDLLGRRILVTAGPTREPLDPVRFLSNRSSGKMGYAVARMARYRGASVVLVSGPTWLEPPAGVEVVRVETAEQMQAACHQWLPEVDAVVMAAAVADFRAVSPSEAKIKREADGAPGGGDAAGGRRLLLELVAVPDILASLAQRRRPGQVLVGFAAETGRLEDLAREKLRRKGVDLIVANDVTRPGAGFESETNAAILLGADGTRTEVPLVAKESLADRILDWVAARLAGPARD